MSVSSRRAYLESQIRRAHEQLEALDQLPQLDDFPNGTIIRCVVDEGGKQYTWAFLKVVHPSSVITLEPAKPESRWYFTGRLPTARNTSMRWATWGQLVDYLISTSRQVVSWDVIWPTPILETIAIPMNDDRS